MHEDCVDEYGMIIKPFEECEKCSDFPCHKLMMAINEIINGEN